MYRTQNNKYGEKTLDKVPWIGTGLSESLEFKIQRNMPQLAKANNLQWETSSEEISARSVHTISIFVKQYI